MACEQVFRANRGSWIVYVYAESMSRGEYVADTGDRCAACPAPVRVQVDSSSIENPVETIRWPRMLVRDMT